MSARTCLELTVVGARHLPKVDLVGKCDGYCLIKYGGKVQRTKTVKNSYSPDWEETFSFDAPADGDAPGTLSVTLMDWDRLGKDDRVGEIVLDEKKMGQIFSETVGWKHKEVCKLYTDETQTTVVKGNDKQDAEAGFSPSSLLSSLFSLLPSLFSLLPPPSPFSLLPPPSSPLHCPFPHLLPLSLLPSPVLQILHNGRF
eukprot:3495138-Rhodomonas_salina.2